jgi:ribonucleoside-diphosphate reductase alpha chain
MTEESRTLEIPALFSKSGYQGYKIFLDRYTKKAPKGDLQVDDLVLVITKKDPKFPQKDLGWVTDIAAKGATIQLYNGEEIYQDFDLISKPTETSPQQVRRRVAHALASCEDAEIRQSVEDDFYDILLDYFIPGGRILAGAGLDVLTLQNCFVLPGAEDSRTGVFDRVKEMAETHSRGGGVGVNLSSLRPRYAHVKGVNGISSGAVSWGQVFNLSTGLIEQGGSRRGATMLMIDDWHPDVFEFIQVKRTPGQFENANMSVCISDAFMEAVEADGDWDLVFPDTNDPRYDELWNGNLQQWQENGGEVRVYDTVKARDIWSLLIESAWASAEPGLHFLERSNKMSNSWYFAPLVATNPCGEQPLEAYGVCTLGALDLSKFVSPWDRGINWSLLGRVITTAVRFLDNVIDINNYHLPEIEENHRSNRRIGLGTMGLGELLLRLNVRYGSDESVELVDTLYQFIAEKAYHASINLAMEKGAFIKYDERYLRSGFMEAMPESVRTRVQKHGIRNVCLLTQAPTGTTGTMMGTSTGIEPYFSWQYTRTSRLGVHVEVVPVLKDLGLKLGNLPEYCVTAQDLAPEDHVKVQAAIQRWTDSAISKTTNAPSHYSIEQTDRLYRLAYQMGCKGVTIYRDQSRHEQVLSAIDEQVEPVEDGVEVIHQGACEIAYLPDGTVYSKCD